MYKVGVIGTGKMGGALTKAILDKKLLSPGNLFIHDPIKEKLSPFIKEGAKPSSMDELSKKVDILIIAVKPNSVKSVLELIKDKLRSSQMVVSIAAGVTISFIRKTLENSIPVVRVMPNAAILADEGMCVISQGPLKDAKKFEFIQRIFQTVGCVLELPENKLDAVTGLSGSGPAYVYKMIQGLIQGGEKAGLSKDTSKKLAAQTVLGAAKLIKETSKKLEELVSSIATPGGTTIEGLKILEKGNLIKLFSKAVIQATKRAKQISLEIEQKI